jgi:hypothetical protein
MKLSITAISILRGNKPMWLAACQSLGVSKKTMYRYVADNDPVLTQASVLKVIREGSGLTDQEILEEEAVKA